MLTHDIAAARHAMIRTRITSNHPVQLTGIDLDVRCAVTACPTHLRNKLLLKILA
jgi:hypothetical protein